MPDNSHLRVVASLSPELQGFYYAFMGVLGGMIDQKAVNRELLIDYLLRLRADLPEPDRQSEYGLWLQVLIDNLELFQDFALGTRRPSPRGGDKPD